jgi:hypothetical protein
MDDRRVQDIKRNFADKLSAELVTIRDAPGDQWSEEAVVAARELIEERKAAGTLEAEDTKLRKERVASEGELADAIQRDTRCAGKHIDSIATLYILAGGLGILLFGYIGVTNVSRLLHPSMFVPMFLGIAFSSFVLATGFGLSFRKDWARMAALVASVPLLFGFPLGTIIAVYSISYLGNKDRYEASLAAERDAKNAA